MRTGLIACLAVLLFIPPATPRILAPDHGHPVLAARQTWQWPVVGSVVRRFEPPPRPWLAGHRGVDLAAAESTLVTAAGSGVVSFAGVVVSRPVVSIAHPNGTRTTYEPVQPLVTVGDEVETGDPIGVLLAGHAGCADPCLHWGLKRGDTYLDPLALVGLARIRLLPTGARRPLHRPVRLIRGTIRR